MDTIKKIKELFDSGKINGKDKRTVERELTSIEKGEESSESTIKWFKALIERNGGPFIFAEPENSQK